MRQGRIALIGLGIAVVLGGAAVGGWWFSGDVGGASDGSHAGSASTPAPTPTPTPSSIPKHVEPNQTFASSSGNLQCSIGLFAGQPGAICQQLHTRYAMPKGACPAEDRSVFVGVGPEGGYWPCVSAWPVSHTVLPYDKAITRSGVTCTIGLKSGVRCTNAAGKGFTMEYSAGVTMF
jgi:hypothetical protein